MAILGNSSLTLTISAKDEASGVLKRVRDALDGVTDSSNQNSGVVQRLRENWAPIAAITTGAGLALGATARQMDVSIDAASGLTSALTGLNSVARAFGVDQTRAKRAAQDLAKDGLMSVTEAATGLKNLLASNFSLDQAITLMGRFKDSAAFGRQSALGFGQAVASATEGIKNGNSILVDNAGVTKNLSVILQEAGFSQQDVMRATSDAGVRMALYNGILKETNPQVGDAARLASQFSGEQAKAGAATLTLRQKIGSALQGAFTPLLRGITPIISKTADWIGSHQRLTAAIAVGITVFLGLVTVVGAIGAAIAVVTPAVGALAGILGVSAGAATLLTGGVFGIVAALAGAAIGLGAFSSQSGGAQSAIERHRLAQDALTNANRTAKVAQDALRGALLDQEGASLRVEQAQRNLTETIRQFGPGSLEAKQATYDLKRAQDDLGNATANVAAKTQEVKQKQDDVIARKEAVKQAAREMRDSANDSASGFRNLANTMQDVVNKQSAIKPGAANGSNNPLSAGSAGIKLPGHAHGTNYAAGGWTILGEDGPEIANLPRGTQVKTASETAQAIARQKGGASFPITINNYSRVDWERGIAELGYRLRTV
ncbi:hypothetical protein [Antrihabitans sp. YC2-6]|uniref:hypothetical protein n=1 Tax=Antrihabitans sp. YC2-6 TaxID=2799498 RepID=UPI0018F28A95|nr:hypothetical protein [Antrihabitans sp. YC2-6]MBJ8343935.1 hypothetical protein [Antrihabitans sp. YC2-6]